MVAINHTPGRNSRDGPSGTLKNRHEPGQNACGNRQLRHKGRSWRGILRRLYIGKISQGEYQVRNLGRMRVIIRSNGFASPQEITPEPPLSSPDSRCLDSPLELATIEHGTYEEVKELLSASARKLALATGQAQTLQQLKRMQDEEPEMLRTRRP
ncbi:MAG: hypothetical protein Q9193_000991, partial [Seirophora villosa]